MAESAFRRVEARLEAPGIEIVPILLGPNGELRRAGRVLTAQDACAEVAWAGSELFIDGLFGALAGAALESRALKWFHSGAAGADSPVFQRLLGRGVRLSTSDAPSEAVADCVLAGVLDYLQRGPERRELRHQKQWRGLPFIEVGGLNWLIIGFGAIGRAVARRATSFGAQVTGVRRRGGSDEFAHLIVKPDQLATVLPKADIVVLALPLGSDTHHMVNSDFLLRMKRGSLLVNVGRGGLVDESALLTAMSRDQPRHAVLDVCSVEPLPQAHPFWTHKQITLTPHLAGMGSGLVARSDQSFVQNLQRFLSGVPLLREIEQSSTATLMRQ
jgi:phosphoglycerate dehydrogenase-like enzyme